LNLQRPHIGLQLSVLEPMLVFQLLKGHLYILPEIRLLVLVLEE
jgi:hypothetical protein